MITRRLTEEDFDNALALMTTAEGGCRFDRARAEVFWVRWMLMCTVLGTFDDVGALYSLRVLHRTVRARNGESTIRLRAQFHRHANTDAYAEDMKRSVRGFVAWLRAADITHVVNVVVEPGRPYPHWLLARLRAVTAGAHVEFTTDALEASLDS